MAVSGRSERILSKDALSASAIGVEKDASDYMFLAGAARLRGRKSGVRVFRVDCSVEPEDRK